MGLEFSNPNNNINNDSNTINNNHHDPNNWTPQNIINVSHEMMGYQNFDEGIHSTTDLLTLLHLPRCTAFPTSSSTTLLPPPTPSISFAKSSTSPPPPPPPPPGLAFLGEMMNQGPMMLENGSSGFGSYDPASAVTLSYDPLFHLNLPPHSSPLLRDLMFQSLPHGFTTNGIQTRGVNGNNGNDGNGNGNGSSSLFGGMEDGEGNNNMGMGMNGISGIYQDGEHFIHPNSVFEFSKGASLDDGKLGKGPKNFVTERQRRKIFTDKYQTLRSLIPSPTKDDRASIVLDAINYINELKREVGEIKLLVERKRISNERVKRHKTEDDTACANGGEHKVNGVDGPVLVKPDPDEAFAGSTATQLRSSWLQRKYKDTEVDVRIVDDEVTIKLVQRKKINCLLSVSRTLDELQLDLRHVAGGHVGDYYSYLFNSKICEGSSVYASAIANKLIEVVERQYATASVAVAPTTSF